MSLDGFLRQVFCMDARNLLAALPSAHIDAVVTDPMHGSSSKKAQYEWGPDPSNGDPETHWGYNQPVYEECRRVLKPSGIIVWSSALKYAGDKRHGRYAGLNKTWFGPHAEWIVTRRGRHVFREQGTQLWLVQTRERESILPPAELNAFVFYDRLPQPPKGLLRHPCPKPWEELAVMIGALTKPGQIILDCFCGTGSTLVAADRLGRLWIGCDISRYYCQLTMWQLETMTSWRP